MMQQKEYHHFLLTSAMLISKIKTNTSLTQIPRCRIVLKTILTSLTTEKAELNGRALVYCSTLTLNK